MHMRVYAVRWRLCVRKHLAMLAAMCMYALGNVSGYMHLALRRFSTIPCAMTHSHHTHITHIMQVLTRGREFTIMCVCVCARAYTYAPDTHT